MHRQKNGKIMLGYVIISLRLKKMIEGRIITAFYHVVMDMSLLDSFVYNFCFWGILHY